MLALWIGPAMRRDRRRPTTCGPSATIWSSATDATVRGMYRGLLWIGSLFILAGQLVAIGAILEPSRGIPAAAGCAIGGVVIRVYFAAGGLLTSARVNVVQLFVKLAGFAVAVPLAFGAVAGG